VGATPTLPLPQQHLTSREVKALLAQGARATAHAGAGVNAVKLAAKVLQGEFPRASRLAVAAPKRLLKRAVDRNLAKRILKETFRLSPMVTNPSRRDVMLTLNASPKQATRENRQALKKALRAATNTILGKIIAPQFIAPKAESSVLRAADTTRIPETR
jgi:ribonuclease P protein component